MPGVAMKCGALDIVLVDVALLAVILWVGLWEREGLLEEGLPGSVLSI